MTPASRQRFYAALLALGHTGPFLNFDVRPEYHARHDAHWTWTGVYFASIMSVLSIIAALVIWYYLRKKLGNRR